MTKQKTNKAVGAFSVISGIAFAAVVVGVALTRNPELKDQVLVRARRLQGAVKSLISEDSGAVGKLGEVSELLKSVKKNSNKIYSEASSAPTHKEEDAYKAQWDKL